MPASRERICLDPVEVAYPDRSELELHEDEGPIRVGADGIDWGEATLEVFWAQQKYGETPVDHRVPNRTVTIPLVVEHGQGVEFEEARAELQAKVARLATEGGHLRRTMSDGSVLYADVVGATLRLSGDTSQALHGIDKGASLVLQCLPDFYGEEIILGVQRGAGGVTTWVEPDIKGNYPARTRLIVSDEDGVAHRGVAFGFRCRNYDAATTAALVYEAEALTPLDQASLATISGASGGATNNAIRNSFLASTWTPVLSTLHTDGHLTHVGAYRVFARVYSTSATLPFVRLAWTQGDFVEYTSNDQDAAQVPMASQWCLMDLGEVRLPEAAKRWQGVIQGKGSGANLAVDRVCLLPLDESSGRVSVPPSTEIGPLSHVVHDGFSTQTSGSLAGKAAVPSGVGNYAALDSGTGDFQVDTTNDRLTRNVENGSDRAAGLALSLGSVDASIDIDWSIAEGSVSGSSDAGCYLYVRTPNTSNRFAFLFGWRPGDLVNPYGRIAKRISGSWSDVTSQFPVPASLKPASAGVLRIAETLRLRVIGTEYRAYVGDMLVASGNDPVLASTLATGGVYFGDFSHNWAGAGTTAFRYYDNFRVSTVVDTAAIFPNRSLELTSNAALREATDGDGVGNLVVYGDNPRLPVSGRESRPVEVLVLNSRGDFDQLPDSSLDDVSVSLSYRPCWLTVPEMVHGSGGS